MADSHLAMTKRDFGAADYAIFVISLLLPAAVGIYYGCFKRARREQQTSRDVLLGSKLGILPVAFALIATYLSAVSVLGFPSEVYHYSTLIIYYIIDYCIVFPTVAFVFLPVLYPLKLTNVYEYLELRFSKATRQVASFLFCFQVFLYLAVVLFAPALALSSVMPLSISASILITGLLASFYTTLGGSNAVVWTSTLQMLMIMAGMLAVVISGFINAGGVENVWNQNLKGYRIQFDEVRLDPRVRHSVWNVIIGGSFTMTTLFAANQMGVQRYFVMPSLKHAQKVVLLNIPLNSFVALLYTLIGLILYYTYGQCDPRLSGLISKTDQILPFYVMDKLSHAVGLPGLFLSSLYGAGLSTIANGFTALAAVLLEDVVKPLFVLTKKRPLSVEWSVRVSKLLSLIVSLVIIGLAFLVGQLKGTVIQIAFSVFGVVGGPLLGTFILGMFFPFCNSKGAISGMLIGFAFTMWLGFGAVVVSVVPNQLPLSTNGCDLNFFLPVNLTMPIEDINRVSVLNGGSVLDEFYKTSYQYYSVIGVFSTVLVGLIIACFTRSRKDYFVDPSLLSLLIRRWYNRPVNCATEEKTTTKV